MDNLDTIFYDSFRESIQTHQDCISFGFEKLKLIGDEIVDSINSGGKLFLCGNGGSAADSQHLAAELVVRLRSTHNRKALPAISLAMDTSTLTACGNDYGFDNIFSRPLEALGSSGDCLLAISTSGNSKNVINALRKAKDLKLNTYGFFGATNSEASDICDYAFFVPSSNTARIQECHSTAGHSLMTYIEDKILYLDNSDKTEFIQGNI